MADPESSCDPPERGTPVLVSACLLGRACRYDGKSKLDSELEHELTENGLRPIPFCPEEQGGLPTPRAKAWIDNMDAAAVWAGKAELVSIEGLQVTREFKTGAELALKKCREQGIDTAFLKERSPSCGVANTYVGNELIEGPGVTAYWLAKHGIKTLGR